MTAISVPRPAWMTEDLVLLEEQAQRFIADEFVPHLITEIRKLHYYEPGVIFISGYPEEYERRVISFYDETLVK